MKKQILILSEDAVFARMLFLEFSMLQLSVSVASSPQDPRDVQVVLVDLDSVAPPAFGKYAYVIGFTKQASLSAVDPDGRCSMILHRPFEIRLLRQEVLTHLRGETGEGERSEPSARLLLVGDALFYGEKSVSLSPRERSIMEYLLLNAGKAVSRDTISSLVGESTANKIDVYVCYLRRKIATLTDKNLIRTIRGKGYSLNDR